MTHEKPIVNNTENLLDFIVFIELIVNIVLNIEMFIYLFIVWHQYTEQINT